MTWLSAIYHIGLLLAERCQLDSGASFYRLVSRAAPNRIAFITWRLANNLAAILSILVAELRNNNGNVFSHAALTASAFRNEAWPEPIAQRCIYNFFFHFSLVSSFVVWILIGSFFFFHLISFLLFLLDINFCFLTLFVFFYLLGGGGRRRRNWKPSVVMVAGLSAWAICSIDVLKENRNNMNISSDQT